MQDEIAYFLLGESFRWSLMGEDDGEENDEDSVINDLDFYLGNYEARWNGEIPQTAFAHWEWEQLRYVIKAQRNSPALTQQVSRELQENPDLVAVPLPSDTHLESAVWIVKAGMRKWIPLPANP
jgi:hypothetical protein